MAASSKIRDTGVEREHALVNLRLGDAAEQVRRRLCRPTQCATKRGLVKRLDDQKAGKDPSCCRMPFSTVGTRKPSSPCNELQSAKLILVGSRELEECHV
jgi:hypothetical protein